jgi:hypothetical protein
MVILSENDRKLPAIYRGKRTAATDPNRRQETAAVSSRIMSAPFSAIMIVGA